LKHIYRVVPKKNYPTVRLSSKRLDDTRTGPEEAPGKKTVLQLADRKEEKRTGKRSTQPVTAFWRIKNLTPKKQAKRIEKIPGFTEGGKTKPSGGGGSSRCNGAKEGRSHVLGEKKNKR